MFQPTKMSSSQTNIKVFADIKECTDAVVQEEEPPIKSISIATLLRNLLVSLLTMWWVKSNEKTWLESFSKDKVNKLDNQATSVDRYERLPLSLPCSLQAEIGKVCSPTEEIPNQNLGSVSPILIIHNSQEKASKLKFILRNLNFFFISSIDLFRQSLLTIVILITQYNIDSSTKKSSSQFKGVPTNRSHLHFHYNYKISKHTLPTDINDAFASSAFI